MAGKVSVAVADVSVEAEVNRAVAELEAAHGPANVLFNHAGTIVIKPFLETTAEEWDWLHAVNVKSMFLMTKAVLPKMLAAGGGQLFALHPFPLWRPRRWRFSIAPPKVPATSLHGQLPWNTVTETFAATRFAPVLFAHRMATAR